MSRCGKVLGRNSSDQGMGSLRRDDFEPVLLDMIGPWLSGAEITVMACGMVGSRQGWSEAGYHRVPCAPAERPHLVTCDDPRLKPYILPGLSQSSPADVMRGEETQIAGFLAHDPDFDGVLCLPGTHTKWARISAGEVVSFQTFMTGEMFALLSDCSVLQHSTKGSDLDTDALAGAVADTLSRPESLAAQLFRLRAADLLDDTGPVATRGRLSGLLLGAELAAARPYWLGQNIALIGAPELTRLYATALKTQSVTATAHEGDALTLAGLTTAYKALAQ